MTHGKRHARQEDRVALFLPALSGGGAERAMVHLANGFAERGLTVDLVLTRAKGPYLADVSSAVNLVDLKASRIIASIPSFARYLRRQRPRYVLSALSPTNCVALWARAVGHVETRIVVSEQNTLSQSAGNAPTCRGQLIPSLVRRTYPSADGIVAISQGVADDLVQTVGLSQERIQVINNPAVTPSVFLRARAPVEHPWFGEGQLPVVLGVGRLTAQKDFPILLHAFARVCRQRPARLVILGEGEERPRLQALARELNISDDFWLPGFVSNPYKYMARSAVFVLSSRWEGFGNVLAEAMACGTALISTDCPSGPAEILGGGQYGRLVPVGNDLVLAEAIINTLDEGPPPSLVERAGYFSVEHAVDRYLDLLIPDRKQTAC